MNKGKFNPILNNDKILIIGKQKTYSDLDDNSKKDPSPAVPSKKDKELIKAKSASSPKTCAEIMNTGKLKFFITSF